LIETTADDGWAPVRSVFAVRFDRPLDPSSKATIVDKDGTPLDGETTIDDAVITRTYDSIFYPFTITISAFSAENPSAGAAIVERTFKTDLCHPFAPVITHPEHLPGPRQVWCQGVAPYAECSFAAAVWVPGEPVDGTAKDDFQPACRGGFWDQGSGIRAVELWFYGSFPSQYPSYIVRRVLPCPDSCKIEDAFSIGIDDVPPGSYTIRAFSYDRAGNRSGPSDPISIVKPI
jgi:hypothetical protein